VRGVRRNGGGGCRGEGPRPPGGGGGGSEKERGEGRRIQFQGSWLSPAPEARAYEAARGSDVHRDGAALQARFLIAAPRRPACRPVRPTLR